jgi:fructose/tagatose bisphosphate aldolase
LGYFESWNLESLLGVLDAAEVTRSPIIIGFNGEFLSRGGRLAREPIAWYAALGIAAARSASVPCGLIFNECSVDSRVREAADSGFNLVMLADPAASYDEYVSRTAAIVAHAHSRTPRVAVEGEVGELPCGASGQIEAHGDATDPEVAVDFVRRTAVDLLAVSVGNVHIHVNGRESLDLKRLAAIRERVSVPLVLHGGTGIDDKSLREAIAMGVAKVNYGTYLKQRYIRAVRAKLEAEVIDPHRVLGMGGPEDVMVAGRHAMRDAVLERIELLGCCGKV